MPETLTIQAASQPTCAPISSLVTTRYGTYSPNSRRKATLFSALYVALDPVDRIEFTRVEIRIGDLDLNSRSSAATISGSANESSSPESKSDSSSSGTALFPEPA